MDLKNHFQNLQEKFQSLQNNTGCSLTIWNDEFKIKKDKKNMIFNKVKSCDLVLDERKPRICSSEGSSMTENFVKNLNQNGISLREGKFQPEVTKEF